MDLCIVLISDKVYISTCTVSPKCLVDMLHEALFLSRGKT